MKKAKPAPPISKLDVLEAISDQLSMDIITCLAGGVTNSDNLMQVLDLSHKQYDSKCTRLSKIGLISRKNREIILTSFGQLVYNAQFKIATAFSLAPELRMIDAIRSDSGISDDEQNRIIDKLLHDTELKKLICQIPP